MRRAAARSRRRGRCRGGRSWRGSGRWSRARPGAQPHPRQDLLHGREVANAVAECAAVRREGVRLPAGAPHQPAAGHRVVDARGVEHDADEVAGSPRRDGPIASASAPSNSISPVAIERVPSLDLSRRSANPLGAPSTSRGTRNSPSPRVPSAAPGARALTTNRPASATEQNHFSPLIRYQPGRPGSGDATQALRRRRSRPGPRSRTARRGGGGRSRWPSSPGRYRWRWSAVAEPLEQLDRAGGAGHRAGVSPLALLVQEVGDGSAQDLVPRLPEHPQHAARQNTLPASW